MSQLLENQIQSFPLKILMAAWTNPSLGTSLVIQWLRLYVPDAIVPRVLPLIRELDPTHHNQKILPATAKTSQSQIN